MKPSFIHLALGLAFALLQAKPATAQSLTFLGDNNIDHPLVTNAGEFTKVGDHVYFWAQGAYGKELYRTNSTGGVELVKDITPGAADTDISRLIGAGDKLFFLTDASYNVISQLWTSDGTAEGTRRVKTLTSNNLSIQRDYPLVALGDEIFFTASNGRLFKTDGTDAGTTTAAGLRIPTYASYGVYMDSLYVGASTAQDSNINLYRTDGTLAGTQLVHAEPGGLNQLVEVSGTLYFSEGGRLWKTDGTEAGTVRITGEAAENVGVMRAAEGKLIFEALTFLEGYELWVTTPDSTQATLIKDITPGGTSGTSFFYLTGFKDKLLFQLNYKTPNGLWITDGTDAGTTIVREYTTDWYLDVTPMVVAGDTVFFEAHTSAGLQLWMTDGTFAGTKSYRDFEAFNDQTPRVVGSRVENGFYACLAAPGDYRKVYKIDLTTSEPTALNFVSGNPAGLKVSDSPFLLNGKVIYTGNDVANGYQLWVSDGTREGTFRLTDFDQTPGKPVFPYDTLIGPLGDSALFLIFRDGNTQLWKTKGNPGDVELVEGIALVDSRLTNLITGGPVAYLFEYDNEPETGLNNKFVKDVWRTDGTSGGTYALNISPHLKIRRPMYVSTDSELLISVETETYGAELWKLDHSTGNFSLLKDINPGTTGSLYMDWNADMRTLNSETYFFANDGTHGTELWKTDGTEVGTQMVKDVRPDTGHNAGNLSNAFTATTSQGEFLFFSHNGFWRTDGTEAGTIRLADIGPESDEHRGQLNGKVYYAGYTTAAGTALWITDGSPEGTYLLKDINPAAGFTTLQSFAATNTAVFFSADDGQHGVELWMTDGTAEGTRLVHDINPGPPSWGPQNTYALGDYIFTTADDGVSGREIWYSSAEMGTAARLADINPGPQSSQAGHFAHFGDTIVFNAFSGETGFDLYSITAPIPQSAAAAEDWALFE